MTTSVPAPASAPSTKTRGMQVELDLLELWVGDLDDMQRSLTSALGFQRVDAPADGGPHEKVACVASGSVTVLLRQGTSPVSAVSRHVAVHGDTIGDVALTCPDPGAVVERARSNGLDVRGPMRSPKIDLFGDGTFCHTVREARLAPDPAGASDVPPLPAIDHVAYCVPWGFMEKAAEAYEQVFGLARVDVADFAEVGGEDVGMRSVVLRSGEGLTVVLTEPASEASTGQTQRFVDAHAGGGVQHAALAYDDLFAAVRALRSKGMQFLPIPSEYYDQAQERLPQAPIPWDELRRLEILVDADEQGLLFQLFMRPIADRETFFFELIQRAGATGFGGNNVRALFAAVQDALDAGRDRTAAVEDGR